MTDFCSKAEHLAKRRSCAHQLYGTGAVIVARYDNKIVSAGWSHMSHIRHNSAYSMHAEIHALGRGRHANLRLRDYVIYVACVRKTTNTSCLAKPCLSCAIALRAAGITHAIYSTNEAVCPTDWGILDLEADLRNLKVYERWT